MKKIGMILSALLLGLLVAAGVQATTVPAEAAGHVHCVCGESMNPGAAEVSGHVCDKTTEWTAWTSKTSLPSNSLTGDQYYYLTEDVELSSPWSPKANTATADYVLNLHLCVNGHKITVKDSTNNAQRVFMFYQKGGTTTLSICDCQQYAKDTYLRGGVYGSNYDSTDPYNVTNRKKITAQGALFCMLEGELNLYSGTYAGGISTQHGGVIAVGGSAGYQKGVSSTHYATVNIYDARIKHGMVIPTSTSSAHGYGGNISVGSNSTLNIYTGTVEGGHTAAVDDPGTAKYGGNIAVFGTANLLSPYITGGWSANMGGNIYVGTNGNVNVDGGYIAFGSAEKDGGNFYLVDKTSTVTLDKAQVTFGRAKGTGSSNGGGNVFTKGTFIMNGGLLESGSAVSKGGNVYVNQDDTSVFEMFGGTIFGGSAETNSGGNVANNGLFIMHDGEISEGVSTGGGNVWCNIGSKAASPDNKRATFIMYGGTIKDGRVRSSAGVYDTGNGANINLNGGKVGSTWYYPGQFYMYGGTISQRENIKTTGSGSNIYVGGYFEMTDGTITGGTTDNYGGVFFVKAAGSDLPEEAKRPQLNIKGGIVENGYAKNSGATIFADSYSALNISGGIFRGAVAGGAGANVRAGSNSIVTISGGTFIEGVREGGDQSTRNVMIGGIATISGGIFTRTGSNNSIYFDSTARKECSITGGYIDRVYVNTNGTSADYLAYTVDGKTSYNPFVSGGYFNSVSDAYIVNGLSKAPVNPKVTVDANGTPLTLSYRIGAFITIAATSKLVDNTMTAVSDMTVSNVQGGDTVAQGETVTLRTDAVTGYDFLGWYVYNEEGIYNGATAKSTAYKYTVGGESETYVALYRRSNEDKIALNITSEGGRFTVTINGKSETTNAFSGSYAFGTEVKVEYVNGEAPFKAWANADGKYMSREENYTFTLGSTTMLRTECSDSANVTVVFLSDYRQLLKTVNIGSGLTTSQVVPGVARIGRTFAGYQVEGKSGLCLNASEVVAAVNEVAGTGDGKLDYVEVVLHYTDANTILPLYTFEQVVSGTNAETIPASALTGLSFNSYELQIGKLTEITVPETINGGDAKFLAIMTKRDGLAKPLSYERTFSIAITEATEVYAVYTTSSETIEKKPATSVTGMSAALQADGKYVYTFAASRVVPEGFTLVEQGILASTSAMISGVEEAIEGMEVDSEAVTVNGSIRKLKSSGLTASGTTLLNMKNMESTTSAYFRGYIIYSYVEDGVLKKGIEYTDIYAGSASAGFKAYGLTLNCECGETIPNGTVFADGTTHVCKLDNYTPWNAADALPTVSGNYILQQDVALTAAQTIAEGNANIVLMLNGKKVTTTANNIYVVDAPSVTLTISDFAGKKGTMTARSSQDVVTTPGMIVRSLKSGTTLNVYNGTLKAGADMRVRGFGGLISLTQESSTFNMYGGQISGGKVINNASGASTLYNVGGNIALSKSSSRFNMYGGTIADGKAVNESGSNTWMAGGNIYLGASAATICDGTITTGYAKYGGNIVTSGTITVYGGLISAGTAISDGGNMELDVSAVLTMYGGNITGGIAGNNGGNIYDQSKYTTGILGGNIYQGSAKNGGNIYLKNNGTTHTFILDNTGDTAVTLYSGTAKERGGNLYITADVTANLNDFRTSSGRAGIEGGDVYTAGNVTLSGTTYIASGYLTDEMTPSNLYVAGPITLDTTAEKAFTTTTHIGVTGPIGAFSTNAYDAAASADALKNFVADDEYRPVYVDGTGKLALGGTPATGIELSTETLTLTGDNAEKTLTVSLVPASGVYDSITWTSQDTTKATVTANADPRSAKVKAVATSGNVTVKVKVVAGSETFEKTCVVTLVSVHSHALETNAHILAGEGAAVTWTPWTSGTTLPTTAGNYYLTKNVTLTAKQSTTASVNLCLNGYTVTGGQNMQMYSLASPAKLSIVDCSEGEKGQMIAQGTTYRGNVIFTSGTTEVTIYGGTLHGACANGLGSETATTGNGGGGTIFVSTSSKLYIHGGVITDGYTIDGGHGAHGGNICVMGEFHMDGGIIENGRTNFKGGNISFLEQKAGIKSTITGGIIRNGIAHSNDTSNTYGGNISVNPGNNFLTGHCLTIGGDAVIEGGRAMENIYSGIATRGTHQGYGGNIAAMTGTLLIEDNAVIRDGRTAVYGGNLFVNDNGTATVTGNTVMTEGYAWMGGGVGVIGNGVLTLSGQTLITNNNCSSGTSVSGAGVYFTGKSLTISDKVQVKENLSLDNILSNIYIAEKTGVASAVVLNGLTEGAYLGFYSGKLNTIHDYEFASSATDFTEYVHSDDPAYGIEYKSGKYSICDVPYMVGFGRADSDPIDPATGTLLAVPMAGYGNTYRRDAQAIDPDGHLFITAVAVKAKDGVVMMVTLDIIRNNPTLVDTMRKQISQATGVKPGNILFTATHTHSGPDISFSKPAATASNYEMKLARFEALDTYVNEVFVPGAVTAAKAAMADLKPVTETSVGQTTVNGMNFVRHYTQSNGFVVGDNFNNFTSADNVFGTFTNLYTGHTTEADGNIQLIAFSRTGGEDVVMMNWRAHTTITGGYGLHTISADYVGPLRTAFENATGAKFAFFQSAAGNINATSRLSTEGMMGSNGKKLPTSTQADKLIYNVAYGQKLADYVKTLYNGSAMHALDMTDADVEIMPSSFVGLRKNQNSFTAAEKHNAKVIADYWTNEYTGSSYTTDAIMKPMVLATYSKRENQEYNANATLVAKYGNIWWTDDGQFFTDYVHQDLGNPQGVIHSPYDSTSVETRGSLTTETFSVPIFAFRIGNMAFAEAPYEMYDTDGVMIREAGYAMGYDSCFVMGYSNAQYGYVPSEIGFTQGKDPLFGSYESDQCHFEPIQFYVTNKAGWTVGCGMEKWVAHKDAEGTTYYTNASGEVFTGDTSTLQPIYCGETVADQLTTMLRSIKK